MKSIVAQRGETLTLAAVLTRAGRPAVNKTLVFRVQGQEMGSALTDAQGMASLSYRVPAHGAGALDVEATSRINGGVYALRKIEIDRASTTAGVAPSKAQAGRWVTLKASLRATQANRPLAGQSLRFLLGGNSVGVAQTDAKGVARLRYRLPADLPLGSHTVEARFAGDSAFRPNIGRASLGVMR
jgi:uncharacterized protein YfaS (alpha-2-macroglobulin family)